MHTATIILKTKDGKSVGVYCDGVIASQYYNLSEETREGIFQDIARKYVINQSETIITNLSETDEEVVHMMKGFPYRIDILSKQYE